jgi:DNA-binding XRE family transcriptional regulator
MMLRSERSKLGLHMRFRVSKKNISIHIRQIFCCQSFFDGIVQIVRLCNPNVMISSAQCRAARSLLDWSQQKLAAEAGVGVVTVRQLEAGTHQPRNATLQVVRGCLEAAGVEFIDENGGGVGVRFRERERRKR